MKPTADIEKLPLLQTDTDEVKPDAPVDKSKAPAVHWMNIFGASTTTLIILYYAACSSTMLVINKVTVHFLPAPTFVLICQLAVSAITVRVLDVLGYVEADKIEWSKLKRFIWVIVGFLGTIFCNIKVLQHSNVETFITFRSSTPLVLSLCDYFFLGRAWPNMRSWICLLFIVLGSAGYVMVDQGFEVRAYVWLFLWYAFFVFDTVYVKHMCESVQMTNWGRVYYTNTLALVPLFFVLPGLSEQSVLYKIDWDYTVVSMLILSCIVGVCMSHAAYVLRDTVSATLFTIVGIICKVVTVIINLLIWDKHAAPEGIAFLSICVLAGTFYQQSPKRT